ncbi:hypothetical protein [Lentilactobacillus parakefiri]|uniref:DUF1659 domain-containing protein n=1 Tax=Lentilactobacillus parakefiri TaxID=152332 RepID=A0A224VH50_9LACO|nr:hypothetical protein [Lentilactobacillus parakefiri]KRL61130.1 hypothetical protein FD08_GL002963 [Lentilactobacillus parakefiri DSM 10551]PAL01532.1 hypothetical protein B8W96_01040 [Lentilactobacillus parakefiri]TDG91179.1 hypothetical protein C5L28_002381 [Lentilactobacillus parakefiri]GAW71811.1 hypothetical protein LPKJCM_00914 [Lentilactobacillus parakefiri]
MQKDWMKSSVAYTLVNEDHKKGVKHSFSYVAQNVTPEKVAAFGKILESLVDGNITDAAVSSVDHVELSDASKVPAAPKA